MDNYNKMGEMLGRMLHSTLQQAKEWGEKYNDPTGYGIAGTLELMMSQMDTEEHFDKFMKFMLSYCPDKPDDAFDMMLKTAHMKGITA